VAFPPRPGTEAFSFDGKEAAVLLLHGFTGSPQGMRLWGEALRGAGFAVSCPVLPGHGSHWRDLALARHPAWAEACLAAIDSLSVRYPKVVIGALSFGGALALHLCANRPSIVRGLVAVNPFLFSTDRRLFFLPLLKYMLASVPGVGSDIADPAMKEIADERVPLKTFASLRAFQGMVRQELPRVTQPVKIFASRQDHVVNPSNARYIADHIGSMDKELIWLDRSYHVATLDHDRQQIFDESIAFFRRVTA
jgi:carboxylesterase